MSMWGSKTPAVLEGLLLQTIFTVEHITMSGGQGYFYCSQLPTDSSLMEAQMIALDVYGCLSQSTGNTELSLERIRFCVSLFKNTVEPLPFFVPSFLWSEFGIVFATAANAVSSLFVLEGNVG